MLRIHVFAGRSQFRSDILRARLPERAARPHRQPAAPPKTHPRQTPIAHWYRESLPIFWLNVLELRFDDTIDPAVFGVQVLQSTGQNHPRLLFSAMAIDPCDLLRKRLLHELFECAALPRRSRFCFAEQRLRNFERSFHQSVSPIFMGVVKGGGQSDSRFTSSL